MSCTSLPRLGLTCILPRQPARREEVSGLKPLRLLRLCHTTVIGVFWLLFSASGHISERRASVSSNQHGKGLSPPSLKCCCISGPWTSIRYFSYKEENLGMMDGGRWGGGPIVLGFSWFLPCVHACRSRSLARLGVLDTHDILPRPSMLCVRGLLELVSHPLGGRLLLS